MEDKFNHEEYPDTRMNDEQEMRMKYLDDLSEEFCKEYPGLEPVEYDVDKNTYYRFIEGEEGLERQDIDPKFYPIITRFLN